MTNAQIITTLTARLIASISTRIECGMTQSEAFASVRRESIAGPAVWILVDAHFAA